MAQEQPKEPFKGKKVGAIWKKVKGLSISLDNKRYFAFPNKKRSGDEGKNDPDWQVFEFPDSAAVA